MKRILLIANYRRSVGGISGQVEILLRRLDNRTIKADLFNTKIGNLKRLLLPFSLFLKGIKFDIFHIHGCSFKGFFPIVIGVIVGKILNKKIIVTYHGGGLQNFFDKYPQLIKYFLSKVDILAVPSKYIFDVFQQNNIKSVLIPNIIREDNVEFKKRYKIKPDLIVTRSLEKIYNIPLAIKAYAKIKNKYKNASLLLVGDGSEMENIKKRVQNMELEDVIFAGRVKNYEIGKILNKADIFINPTTSDSFSVSMFEAFACGLPVISTDVGAISDFVSDGDNGFLIDSDNVEQLVARIEYIIENQKDTQGIIERAFDTFNRYTFGHIENKYLDLYK